MIPGELGVVERSRAQWELEVADRGEMDG